MALKYVYALVSNAGDCYTEQALVSMHSLRRHNPDAHITLVTDDDTLNSLTGNRSLIKNYVDEYVPVNPPSELTPVQKSRFLKTLLRQSVNGDFLYIDNDTVIVDSLCELDDTDCEMAAVLNLHLTENISRKLQEYIKITHKDSFERTMGEGDTHYFNSGVLLVRDTATTHKLYADWHRIWNEDRVRYGVNIDQPSFAQANIADGCLVKELEGRYNCQISTPNAKKYLIAARIIHYFHSSQNEHSHICNILNRIKEEGLTDELQKTIDDPGFVISNWMMLDEAERRIYELPMSMFGRKIAREYPYTNKIVRYIHRLFR